MSMSIFALLEAANTAATVAASPTDWLVKALIISVVIGAVIGLVRALSLKSQLVSVHRNDSAADYTRDKSFKVELSRDSFLYSKTEKEEKPQQSQAQNK